MGRAHFAVFHRYWISNTSHFMALMCKKGPDTFALIMLRISKDQFKTFDELARARLHQRILVFLRQHLPAHVQDQDDSNLLKWIAACDQRAALYGIKRAGAVTQFVTLSLLAGMDFHMSPATNKFLRHSELTGEQKMRLLASMLATPKGT